MITTLAIAAAAFSGANSGLAVGEMVTPFHPNHIFGPNKGTNACPPCTYGNRPAVQVWVNEDDSKNVVAIANDLSDKVKASKHELKAFVIQMTCCQECVDSITAVAKQVKADNIGIAHIAQTDSAVKNYKINTDSEVKNTVIVYKDKKVVAKFVNLKADKKGLDELNAAIAKVDN